MDPFRVGPLPDGPLDAAAEFHARVLPELPQGGDLVLVFPSAGHDHRAWRLAVVQGLARERAPGRANAIESDDPEAIAAAARYLSAAPGVTGHLLVLDSEGAGDPILPGT